MRNFSLALIASLGLVACVGGIEAPPADDTGDDDGDNGGVGDGGTGPAAAEAKRLYEQDVHPVVAAKCIGCHNASGPVGNITGFVDSNLATAYSTASGYQIVVGDYTPAGAPIITKVTVSPTSPHASLSYSTDEVSKMTAWLNKELEARTGTGPGPGPGPGAETPQAATLRLMQEWSGCMDLANFETANMKAWGNVQAGNSACKTCHNGAEYGMIASSQNTPFFDIITSDKYYMLQYFSVDLTTGVANAKVIVNTRSFVGVAGGIAPHASHPQFDALNNNGMEALNAFYDLTAAAKAAAPNGVCGPPKLLN